MFSAVGDVTFVIQISKEMRQSALVRHFSHSLRSAGALVCSCCQGPHPATLSANADLKPNYAKTGQKLRASNPEGISRRKSQGSRRSAATSGPAEAFESWYRLPLTAAQGFQVVASMTKQQNEQE